MVKVRSEFADGYLGGKSGDVVRITVPVVVGELELECTYVPSTGKVYVPDKVRAPFVVLVEIQKALKAASADLEKVRKALIG